MRFAALLVAVLALTPATAAAAEVVCVDTEAPDCTIHAETLGPALATGAPLVRLGPGPSLGTFSSDTPVEIAGTDGAVIKAADPAQPALELTGATVKVTNVTIDGTLKAANHVTLADVSAGSIALDTAQTAARNLSVAGAIAVAGGQLTLSSSVVGAPDPFVVSGTGTVTTDHSAYAADPNATGPDRVAANAPLVDAGDPGPLAAFEPFVDVLGETRMTDGDGDGVVRRDIGAFELQPAAVALPSDTTLVNGDAEDGLTGWVGDFVAADYGGYLLPSERAGAALGGGTTYFSGGAIAHPRLFQRVDVSADALRIDLGQGVATLSALVGYGADADTFKLEAVFKDPEGDRLGTLALTPVTAADRGNASNLLYRRTTGPIPRRTRAVDVVLAGDRTAGSYTDAYADNVALTMNVRGTAPVVVPQSPDDPPVIGLRPFGGVVVLSPRPVVRAGRMRLGLACANSTVGGCGGSIAVDARLPGSATVTQIAPTTTFYVPSGRTSTARIQLDESARLSLRGRRARRALLRVDAQDAQGVSRAAVVPVRLRLRPARK